MLRDWVRDGSIRPNRAEEYGWRTTPKSGQLQECFLDGYLAIRNAPTGLTGYSGHLSQR
jgi:hypothetical protein